MLVVALKIIQEQYVVALDHALKTQTKLRLKTNRVVKYGNERCIQQVEVR